MDAAKHPALLMVDCVASLGCMPFEMDGWGVDVAMAGSQKGMMTPPGLAFVAANERAHAAHKTAGLRTLYWDWTFRQGEEHYQKYCGTPPEHLLFGMRKALDMLYEEGLDERNPASRAAGRGTCGARSRWAEGQVLAFNIVRSRRARELRDHDSHAGPRPEPMLDYTREKCGVVLGVGIGSCRARRSASRTWATSTRRW